MKTILRLCFLIHLFAIPALLSAQKIPQQSLYTVDLSPLVPQGPEIYLSGSLAFITDHTLAVGMCSNAGCNLETLDLAGGKPQTLAWTNELGRYSALFRAPDGRVVLNYMWTETSRGSVLLDSDLNTSRHIPATTIDQSDISSTGETFVQRSQNDWVAYKMALPPVRIRAGTGQVLSVSDDAVAVLDRGNVRIEGMDAKVLGSFSVGRRSRAAPMLRFLGKDRLWFDGGGKPEIRDLNGKTFQKFDRPEGWGFRIGQSSDGTRLLLDQFTRHVPLAQSVKETAIAVATLGMGVGDESSNGEMVLVIDTRSGKQCFEWTSKIGLLLAGGFHADVDPSGQLIAIMTRTTLALYSVPDTCTAK
jgi:hypothetical protein